MQMSLLIKFVWLVLFCEFPLTLRVVEEMVVDVSKLYQTA